MYPYAGRTAELSWLRAQLATALAGPAGRVVLVSGEAGSGKSRLLAEATADVPVAATITFPRAELPAPGAGLAALARQGGRHAQQLQSELAETGVDDAGWRTSRICKAADALVRSCAPAVVVVEDVQWADELTLQWLERAADQLRHTPVAVVLTVRAVAAVPARVAAAVGSATRLGMLDQIHLRPLSVADVAALATAAGHELDDEAITRLHGRSDGLPLAVEALLEGGPSHEISTSTDRPAGEVLATAVRQQMAELSGAARNVVVIASLCPQPASVSTLRAVARLGVAEFVAAAEEAVNVGLLVDTTRAAIGFRHELHRESVQHDVAAAERVHLHHAIAVSLAERGGAPASQVATQYLAAGDDAAGALWLERAAQEAVDAHDHGNALTMLTAAIELDGDSGVESRVVALTRQAVIAARAGDQPQRGLAALDAAEPRLVSDAARGSVLLHRARLVSYSADFSARFHALQRARRAFEQAGDDSGLARALGELAVPAGDAITLDDRIALGREGLALARRAGDAIAVALCAAHLATAMSFSGDYDTELWQCATAPSLLAVPEGRELLARILCNCAVAATNHARYAEALTAVREAAQLRSEPFYRSVFDALEALCSWRLGDWGPARELAERSRGEFDFPYARVAEVVRCAIDVETQRNPEVSSLGRTVEQLIEGWDEFSPMGQAGLMRIRALRREPRPDRGLSALTGWVIRSQTRAGWEDVLMAAADLGPEVLRQCDNAVARSRPAGRRGQAALDYATGIRLIPTAPAVAVDHLLASAAAFESLGEPWPRARSLEGAARALAAQGRHAVEPRREAADIYVQLGADRSLATLIREQGRSPALDGYTIPAAQVRSTTPGLTRRERDVADLARLALTVNEIAQRLGISARTAEHHLESVRRKFGLRRTRELVALLADGGAGATA